MEKQHLLAEILGPEEASRLADADLSELFGIRRAARSTFAVGEQAAGYGHARLMAARKLYAMALEESMSDARVFDNPRAVKEFLVAKLSGLDREICAALWLSTKHNLIAFEELAHGTIDHAQVYPREVVKRALEQGAAAVILCHNHPSGNEEPSRSDATLTNRLKEALALVEVRVLDHVIVAGNKTTSMAEKGVL
jgi:DNA repair protein RadC